MDAEGWLAHLAPDVVMQFANEDPVYGRAGCEKRVRALFASVLSIRHEVLARWDHGDAMIVEATATFGLAVDDAVTIPMVTIVRTGTQGLISDYRVYADPSPIWP